MGAEIKTSSIIQDLIAKFGMEKSFEEYEKNMAEFGYDIMERKAIDFYQNPLYNVKKTRGGIGYDIRLTAFQRTRHRAKGLW